LFFSTGVVGRRKSHPKKKFLTWKDDHILSTFSSPHKLIF
jgi:hypothetical protein